ncbi:MAG: sulfotransferase domain-containing protein [Rhodothermia bacterium]|nr:sulfotransferase domain-containing protein [Rhodothermia bacterium]
MRALPDFIIAGVMKGGTTSLFDYLGQHPQVVIPQIKEIHYFDLNFHRGEEWYRSHFPPRLGLRLRGIRLRKRVITGEASPYYTFHPLAPERIIDRLPGIRVIVLLRDPVRRAISHYHHMIRKGRETLSFAEAVHAERERLEGEEQRIIDSPEYSSNNHQHFSYVARGVYIRQLERFETLREKGRLLVLSSEALFQDTQTTFDRVTDFLQIDRHTLEDVPVLNVGTYGKEDADTIRELRDFYRPFNSHLQTIIDTKMPWLNSPTDS